MRAPLDRREALAGLPRVTERSSRSQAPITSSNPSVLASLNSRVGPSGSDSTVPRRFADHSLYKERLIAAFDPGELGDLEEVVRDARSGDR
jgi:hypothetical protein